MGCGMETDALRTKALAAVSAGDAKALEQVLMEELAPQDVLFVALQTREPRLRAVVLHAPSRWPDGFKAVLADDEVALLEAKNAGADLNARLGGVLSGWNAVQVAAALGSTACLRRLMEWAVPMDRAEVLQVARHYEQAAVEQLLSEAG